MGEKNAVAGDILQVFFGVVVNSLEMLEQNPPGLELLRTSRTLTKYVSCVDPSVIVQSTCLIESFTTFFTHIWLFVCVDSFMSIEVTYVAKTLATDITAVLFNTRMAGHVRF